MGRQVPLTVLLAAAGVVGVVAVIGVARDVHSGVTKSAVPAVAGEVMDGSCTTPAADATAGKNAVPFDQRKDLLPGLSYIDTGEFAPTDAVAAFDAYWFVAADPADDFGGNQFLGRVSTSTETVQNVAPIVAGCAISDLDADENWLWAVTCDDVAAPGSTSGGLVLQIDPNDLTVVRSVSVGSRCLGEIDAGKGAVAVMSYTVAGEDPGVWVIESDIGDVSRVPIDGYVEELSISGQQLVIGAVGPEGQRLTRVELLSPDKQSIADAGSEILAGVQGDTMWSVDYQDRLVARRSARGDASLEGTTEFEGLLAASVDDDGLFVQSADYRSTILTISHVDSLGGTSTVATVDTGSVTRSGFPANGTVIPTDDGQLFLYRGALFKV